MFIVVHEEHNPIALFSPFFDCGGKVSAEQYPGASQVLPLCDEVSLLLLV
jgi:hypothetical protein